MDRRIRDLLSVPQLGSGEPRGTRCRGAVATRHELATRTLAWKVLRHASRLDDEAYLGRVAGAPSDAATAARGLLDELRDAPELVAALSTDDAGRWALLHERMAAPPHDAVSALLDLGGPGRVRPLLLYAALRRRRPSVVIETGCFTGWDSAVILLALRRNGHGHLYTIDLPGYTEDKSVDQAFRASLPLGGLPRELSPGFLVPEVLRDRWTLCLGDACTLLPALLGELEVPVDVFFHDSEHSYRHMMWEYTTVAPYLAAGALLASDDLSFNTAFWDFCVGMSLPRVLHRADANVGATVWRP